jgi:thymidylate synthase ThyX
MSYSAKVIADSIADGVRLTTLEVTFPRYILAEFNTHRVFSRNSASSRAIPVKTRVQQVRENPFIPTFTKNKPGMKADEVLVDDDALNAAAIWKGAALQAAQNAESLAFIEVHKQQANRLLEAFVWHTVVVTSTYWDNFWALRAHVDASPEMFETAVTMRKAMKESVPQELQVGDWHIPYVEMDRHHGEGLMMFGPSYYYGLINMSVARCAALSYERQNVEKTAAEYALRHDQLKRSGHWSPFEHQAKVANAEEMRKYALWKYTGESFGHETFKAVCIGNLAVPWLQYRKTIPGEDVFVG